MIEITNDNIDGTVFKDKQWSNPRKKSFIKRLSKEAKIIMYLLSALVVFIAANVTLIYSFYKILIKL